MSAIEPKRSVNQANVATVEPNEPERRRTQMTMHGFHARAWRGATVVLVIASLAFGAAHAEHTHANRVVGRGAEIGAVDFGADCGIEGLDRIDQALGLLHHMLYEQSRSVFAEVAEEDPSCAMAHWGVATTLFQPLWSGRPSPEALQRGWEATERARAVVGSVREDRLIEAAGAFFRDPESADDWTRIERWAAGMRDAYVTSPGDLDTAALYALSRIALASISEDRSALFDEAEAVLQWVFATSPTHPGGVHYAIHAADVDGRADPAVDRVAVGDRVSALQQGDDAFARRAWGEAATLDLGAHPYLAWNRCA
jgi:hypothetical protein